MNRKQKIIVSVTGIFLVALILMGLTYAYFLTQIIGNTNSKSISVTTTNLELTYGDGNGVLEAGDKLRPGNAVNFKSGNTTLNEKTFTVKNTGDATDYVVIVDEVIVTPEPFESNDFVYTLTCKSYKTTDYNTSGTNATETGKCAGVTSSTFYLKNQSILVGNRIDEGLIHVYSLTMEYKETNKNQSDDMGKTFSARINIEDIGRLNPYSSNTSSLAYNIINNSLLGKNGTELLATAGTPVAEDIARYGVETIYTGASWDYGTYNELFAHCLAPSASSCTSDMIGLYLGENCGDKPTAIITGCDASGKPIISEYTDEYESSLAVEQDDSGTSYYYRGNVVDNYVTFADMCWRIVRIAGDGSTKLILEDQDQPCSTSINGNWAIPTTIGGSTYTGNFGYTDHASYTLTTSDGTKKNSGIRTLMDYLHGKTNLDSSMATAFKNFQSTFTDTELSKLKSGNWCLSDKAYDGDNNILTPMQVMDYKINGTSITYDSSLRLTRNNRYQPTLKCNGTIMNDWEDNATNPTPMYVGTITADEVVYAGGKHLTPNQNYYLINDEFIKGSNGANKSYYFWSLSLSSFLGSHGKDSAYYISTGGDLGVVTVNGDDYAFRPSVSLASTAVISEGEGTLRSPYVIG